MIWTCSGTLLEDPVWGPCLGKQGPQTGSQNRDLEQDPKTGKACFGVPQRDAPWIPMESHWSTPNGLWTAFGSKLGQLGPPSWVGGPPSWPNFDPKLSRNGTPETRGEREAGYSDGLGANRNSARWGRKRLRLANRLLRWNRRAPKALCAQERSQGRACPAAEESQEVWGIARSHGIRALGWPGTALGQSWAN